MRREWTPEDLIASWTLVEADWGLVANKIGATRQGFAVLLKFFELEGRFARHLGELTRQAVEYVAQQVKVAATEIAAQAGLCAFSPHDLRRTSISDLLDLTGDLALVSELAGHANPATTKRYDRRPAENRRLAARSLRVPYQRRPSSTT